MNDFDCPVCEFEFTANRFEDGECPNCKNTYTYGGEDCTQDFTDCWDLYYWERYRECT